MEPGVADAPPVLRSSAPALVQRAPKRKRADRTVSPSADEDTSGTQRATRRRRMSAPVRRAAGRPAAQQAKAPEKPSAREREALNRQMRRKNARLQREAAAAKRAASSAHPAEAAAGSPPAAHHVASPGGRNGFAVAPPSPDMAGPVQVLAAISCFLVRSGA